MEKDDTDPPKRGRGQPYKGFDKRVPVDLNAAIIADMDAALMQGEKRSDFIRAAIAREVQRRRAGSSD